MVTTICPPGKLDAPEAPPAPTAPALCACGLVTDGRRPVCCQWCDSSGGREHSTACAIRQYRAGCEAREGAARSLLSPCGPRSLLTLGVLLDRAEEHYPWLDLADRSQLALRALQIQEHETAPALAGGLA